MDGAGPELDFRFPVRSPLRTPNSGLEDGVRYLEDGAGPELWEFGQSGVRDFPTRSVLEDGVRNLPVRSVLEDAASPPLSSPPPVFFLACAFDA
eukprot:gene9361-biopygen5481